MKPIRCARCFSDLEIAEYDCGTFVTRCECFQDEIEEAEQIAHADGVNTVCEEDFDSAYNAGVSSGYDDGLDVGYKRGVNTAIKRLQKLVIQ